MEEDPNSVPRLGKRMDAPISWQVINHHCWSSIFHYICPSGSAKAQFSNIFSLPVGQKGCCLEWPRKPTTGRFHSSQKWSTLLAFSCNMSLGELKPFSLNSAFSFFLQHGSGWIQAFFFEPRYLLPNRGPNANAPDPPTHSARSWNIYWTSGFAKNLFPIWEFFLQAARFGFRYVQVPGQFYKREYLLPSASGFEKRARDLTSRCHHFKCWRLLFLVETFLYSIFSLNGVPMMGKRGSDGFPPYNIDIRYEE